MLDQEELERRVRAEVPRALEDLRSLVAIPSVSSLTCHRDDVRRSAELTRDLLAAVGVDARVVEHDGSRPAVIGAKRGRVGASTVLLYAHHDVQPVGTQPWTNDPFTLEERDGRVFGRGSSDDKGAIALHLAVLRAFGDQLPVNVVLFVEGEEELGSPSLHAFLRAHADELRADAVVVPDAVNPDPHTPSLTTMLRGNADLVVQLTTLTRPVHSGLYGGLLPCALTSLVALLGTLFDESGRSAVPGLRADPGPPPAVLLDLEGMTDTAEHPPPDPGLAGVLQPSVTVLALDAVPVDEASNVLHPTARAKLGIRVPPSHDPDAALDAVEQHLRHRTPTGARLTLTRGRRGKGFRAGADGDPWLTAARAGYEHESVALGAGGSIPFLSGLQQHLPEARFFVTAVQDAASRAHSSDESLHLEGFTRACLAHAALLVHLSAPSA